MDETPLPKTPLLQGVGFRVGFSFFLRRSTVWPLDHTSTGARAGEHVRGRGRGRGKGRGREGGREEERKRGREDERKRGRDED